MCLLLLVLIPAVSGACYWNDRTSYGYYGSKTPYDDVRADLRDVSPLNECEPVNIWSMIRHGTRHPSSDDIETMRNVMVIKDDILKSHSEGRGELCAQDITNLKNWKWDDALNNTASELTDEGYQELFELGERFHEKFYPLLEKLNQYHFRPSTEQRTKLSAKAFTEGLGLNTWIFNVSVSLEKDDVVRPYKDCDKRTEEILGGPQIQNELNKYYDTQEFKQNATGLYDLCRYNRAYTATRKDAWCAVFSTNDLEIMEYTEDIKHYFRNGYGGGSVNVKLGELPLKDLFDKFQSANNVTSVTGYFSHDTMIEMIISALGLYNDYPHISGFKRVKNRQWRSSFFAPFAANFVAVLNRCNNEGSESFKVQFFINEHELHLCNARACDWQDFYKKFSVFQHSDLGFCSNTKIRNHT